MRKIAALLAAALVMISAATAQARPFTVEDDEYWIKIDKAKLRLYLMKGDEPFKSFPVAIGRGKGDVKKDRLDLITPVGVFKVRRILQDARNLVFDPAWFNEPGEPQKGVYGSKLISFYNPWQIAIHGTNSPGSIGKRVTHGCIRMRNRDIEKLVAYIAPGTKIWITPGEVKNGDQPKGDKAIKAPEGTWNGKGAEARAGKVRRNTESAKAPSPEPITMTPQDQDADNNNSSGTQDAPNGTEDPRITPSRGSKDGKKEYL
ncbi:hypothetical protein TheveDRAFT_1224 [Thermanaerovibrio velox DSM 12556]|uniref:L,D-TPase catalytic domain-containing protein n=1 Tax=Thermanaerovibrio velox DSM 12556 TaxID=926567 RepID=H0UN61_9BACT|nr:L,D-transpeptidase [Thermanaerovibrio velox]EHM10346.1 hypothetical protein TheveDRAFT_1224 [Thermanaerovibrio velox DSM 12556]